MRMFLMTLVLFVPLFRPPSAIAQKELPRFTEEREVAARFFVKKHLPELLPFLDLLKQNNFAQYQKQISEIFRVSEMLADIAHEKRVYELELEIWKTENRSHLLVARMATSPEEERKLFEKQLLELAKKLVALDVEVLELKEEQLEDELNTVRDQLSRMRQDSEQHVRDRYERLLEKARRLHR
ncbi:MAG: hypothetical protein KatS3mg105_1605 [Gemmatales bacterium]|nr:MAG: hypothetical protein KatS3mg105_1605 [Gemmatales bacterium]